MHPWPIPLHDVEDAVAYLQEHAGEWNINPDQMSVMGDSAGGELASFVGLTLWHGEEPAVRGVVDLFGPTDRQPFAEEWRRRYGLVPNPVYGLYTPQRIWSESVVSHVRLGAPPFLIIQGTRDRVVPPIQSELLKERLQEYAVPVKEILVENAGHELVARGGPISPDIDALIAAIADFVAGVAGSHQPP
jgi:acetyl esterase/lipase